MAIAALAGITALVAGLSGTDKNNITWHGLPAFFIVGAALHFWGRNLNITRPAKQLASQTTQRSAGAEETPMASSHRNLEQFVFTEAEGAVLKRLENRYTMLFLPIQWWGFILPLIGIVVTIANMYGSN